MIKTADHEKLFRDLGMTPSPTHMHAELAWMLGVDLPEEELLKNMRKTTRYLIRKAQSDGVEIVKGASPEYLAIFSNLYRETALRHNFTAFSENYLKKEFDAFKDDDQVLIFLAKYNNEFIAGAMIMLYDESAFYHHGASSTKYPKIPAPYLLQWEAIKEAKNRGLRFYNFWGIAPPHPESTHKSVAATAEESDNKPQHPWAGLTLFKKGFGGFDEEYVPAQDLVLKRFAYTITYWFEKMRRRKRGL